MCDISRYDFKIYLFESFKYILLLKKNQLIMKVSYIYQYVYNRLGKAEHGRLGFP